MTDVTGATPEENTPTPLESTDFPGTPFGRGDTVTYAENNTAVQNAVTDSGQPAEGLVAPQDPTSPTPTDTSTSGVDGSPSTDGTDASGIGWQPYDPNEVVAHTPTPSSDNSMFVGGEVGAQVEEEPEEVPGGETALADAFETGLGDPQVTEAETSSSTLDIPTSADSSLTESSSTPETQSNSETAEPESSDTSLPSQTEAPTSSSSDASESSSGPEQTDGPNPSESTGSTSDGDASESVPVDSSDSTTPGTTSGDASEPSSETSTDTGTSDGASSTPSDDGSIPVGTPLPDGVNIEYVAFPGLLSPDDIEHRFGVHRATIEGPEATNAVHAELRRNFKSFVTGLNSRMPKGREAALAFTALEEASMWAHKAIAAQDPILTDEPEEISAEESENRVLIATMQALFNERRTNPYVHDQLASLGL